MITQEQQYSFFSNMSQETKQEGTSVGNGLEAEYELLKKQLITGKSQLDFAIKARDARSLGIFLDCHFSSNEEKNKYIDCALNDIFQESQLKSRQQFTSIDVIIIRKLLKYRANASHGLESRLISVAVESGNFQLVKLLCTYGAEIKRCDSTEENPLVIAAKNGRRDLIELLLKYKAVVNVANFSDSALESALRNGHTECAKLLIQRGAKMDITYALMSAVVHQVSSYLHFLFKNYNREIMHYFLQKPLEARKLLTLAVKKGNCEIISQILDAGISEMDSWVMAPVLASKNRADSEFQGKHFVDNRTSVKCRNGAGKTPLMIVASHDKCVNILQVLLDNGADVHDRDNKGDTALMCAVMKQKSKNVTCLIDSARDKKQLINIQNNQGLSPLLLSVLLGNVPMTKELIENGADVNIRDMHENTALHHLLLSPSYHMNEILTSLLDAGCKVNCHNRDGLSPLMLAVKCQNPSMMSQLLDAGADVNDVSKKMNTPKTALSFVSEIIYHGYSTVFCIEILLDRGAESSYINHKCLHRLLLHKQINVILRLIKHGAGPVEVEANKIGLRIGSAGEPSTVSPLRVALLVGQVELARLFVDIVFLTQSDLSMFRFSQDMVRLLLQEEQEDSLHFLQELVSNPLCLVKLCLVSVLAAVGTSPERVARVNSLPLPQVMKDRLLFR